MNCFDAGLKALHARGLKGGGIRVGLLDTGVDPEALPGQLAGFAKVSDDGFYVTEPSPADSGTHGTRMANTILRTAPHARLVVCEVIERGDLTARILTGLEWLVETDVSVICLPLGLPLPAPALGVMVEALEARGILLVAASGNSGAGSILAPAAFDSALSVGALEDSGKVPAFSGSAETGSGIKPSVAVSVSARGGTSDAAAKLAGLSACLLAQSPLLSTGAVATAIQSSARPIAGSGHRTRFGAVDPIAALNDPVRVQDSCAKPAVWPALGVTKALQQQLVYTNSPSEVRAVVTFTTMKACATAVRASCHLKTREYRYAPVTLVTGTAETVSRFCTARGVMAAEPAAPNRSCFGHIWNFSGD